MKPPVLRRTIQGQRVTLRHHPNAWGGHPVFADLVWEVRDEAGTILGTVRRFYPCWWWAYPRGHKEGGQSSASRDGAVALLLQAMKEP